MVVPLTVIVSPLAKLAEREFVPAAPDSAVALVIAVGGVDLLFATAPVALLDGSKKSLPAATAEAATRSVFATFPIEVFKAALRFAAVAAGVAPIAKVLAGAGVVLDAVNVTDDVVPSGRLKLSVTASPGLGLVEPKLNDTAAGEPDGPVTVVPVSDDVTELSFRPNGEPAASAATENDDTGVAGAGGAVVVTGEIVRRPRPVVPSATARSAMTCFRPAWVPLPLRIELASATAGVLMALPENRKRSPACVLRIPTIEESSVSAFCCPMV